MDALAALDRPALPKVRWTTPDQWHVTLRFFGDVDDPASVVLPPTLPSAVAVVGDRAFRLGRDAYAVPVAGLDDLAAAVVAATADVGQAPPRRPFRGHLTLAWVRGNVTPSVDVGALAGLSWAVEEVTVVRSVLGRGGSRYEVLERTPVRK